MQESDASQLRLIRGRQAARLIEMGVVQLPDWMPALVDDDLAAMPIVALAAGPGRSFLTIGWRSRRPGTVPASRVWIVGEVRGESISARDGYTLNQCLEIYNMAIELQHHVSPQELEGWP